MSSPALRDKKLVTEIRRSLEDLFAELSSIRTLINDAGLRPAKINFSGSAVTAWNSVLEVATISQIESILALAFDQYPEQKELERLLEAVRATSPRRVSATAKRSSAVDRYRSSVLSRFTLAPSDALELVLLSAGNPSAGPVVEAQHFFVTRRIRVVSANTTLTSTKDILASGSCVVRGGVGSGKTSWLRRLMWELLLRSDVVPFFMPVRDLVLDNCLRGQGGPGKWLGFLDKLVGPNMARSLRKVFTTPSGAIPVVLLDGLEDAGPSLDDVRAWVLTLKQESPQTLVIATHRRNDDASGAELPGVVVLELLPLNNGEITEFVRRHFVHIRGIAATSIDAEVNQVVTAILRNSATADLVRGPMFLSMALALEVSPGKHDRHSLYRESVHRLLQTSIPQNMKLSAALTDEGQRVECAMAIGAAAIDRLTQDRQHNLTLWSEAEMVSMSQVPRAANPVHTIAQQREFVLWLGLAGILRRTSGQLRFTHTSFQNVLAGLHMAHAIQSNAWTAKEVIARIKHYIWFDAIILGIHFMWDTSPQETRALMDDMTSDPDAFWAVGAALLDGVGDATCFTMWLERLSPALSERGGDVMLGFMWSALYASSDRRLQLFETALVKEAEEATWTRWRNIEALFGGLRLRGLARGVPRPQARLVNAAAVSTASPLLPSRDVLAMERAVSQRFSSSLHDSDPDDLLLYLWPSARREIGGYLQLAVACGAPDTELRPLARYLVVQACKTGAPTMRDVYPDAAKRFVQVVVKAVVDLQPRIAKDPRLHLFAQSFITLFELGLARFGKYSPNKDMFWRAFSRSWDGAFDFGGNDPLHIVEGITQNLAHVLAIPDKDSLVRPWQTELEFAVAPRWLRDFAYDELGCMGRPFLRMFLMAPTKNHRRLMLQKAFVLSIRPGDAQLERQFAGDITLWQASHTDPFWPLFFRYVARISTAHDQQQLIQYAQNPERESRDREVCAALRLYVRGDVMRSDGELVSLDMFVDADLLALLPALEPMPSITVPR